MTMLKIFDRKQKNDSSLAQLPELKDVLGAYELPSFPRSAMAVLRELRDPETGVDAIADHVALDPGLHLRVLKTINAAAFGLSRKVDDLEHALALLGRAKLESLVVAVAVKKMLAANPTEDFDMNEFWIAAARRASLARRACSIVAPRDSAEAMTVGLLQDLAVPVLARVRRGEYVRVYDQWRHDSSSELVEMEREAFGFDHAQVGSLIAREWELSERMADLILHHHVAESADGLTRSVRLTSRVRDLPGEHDAQGLIERTQDVLGIGPRRAESVVEQAFDDARDFLNALN